jgi:hypothetical protein
MTGSGIGGEGLGSSTTRNVGWSDVLFPIYERNCDKIEASFKDLETRH